MAAVVSAMPGINEPLSHAFVGLSFLLLACLLIATAVVVYDRFSFFGHTLLHGRMLIIKWLVVYQDTCN